MNYLQVIQINLIILKTTTSSVCHFPTGWELVSMYFFPYQNFNTYKGK